MKIEWVVGDVSIRLEIDTEKESDMQVLHDTFLPLVPPAPGAKSAVPPAPGAKSAVPPAPGAKSAVPSDIQLRNEVHDYMVMIESLGQNPLVFLNDLGHEKITTTPSADLPELHRVMKRILSELRKG